MSLAGVGMLDLTRGQPVHVRTPCGSIEARKLVLAMNAWMARCLPQFERTIAIVSSDIVITEKCPELLRETGLDQGVSVLDSRRFVYYYRSTPHGRLMLGKGGNTFAWAGRIAPVFDQRSPYEAELTRAIHAFFPALRNTPITASWNGPSVRSVTGPPFFGRLVGLPYIVYGVGYCVHLYGPFFAEDKVGCHSAAGRREPTAAEYHAYFESGLVRIATCAAELPGAVEFYREAKKRRCLITCGHSNASWPEMAAAFKAGMRHVDHFWCAMSNVASVRSRLGVPMRGSMLEFVLGTADMSTEVIADGCHLSPELLQSAFQFKGASRLLLVTDCNRALDLPPGRYRFGNERDGSWFIEMEIQDSDCSPMILMVKLLSNLLQTIRQKQG